MSLLKRNIIANLSGGVLLASLTLAITPLQINLLGMESFGLISFMATLQIIVSVLDLGLSTTITRELAGDHSTEHQASRPLLRTVMSLYWGMAVLIGFVFFAISDQVAHAWFTSQEMDMTVLEKGLQVVGFFIALRWPISLYVGALAGVQRMDVLNMTKVSVVSFRLVGGILVLLAWPDVVVFLYWSAFSALVELVVYMLVCRKVMPYMHWCPGFSSEAVRAVWGFSLSMNALALLSIGITQLDRLLISKMLPLHELGNYSLAYTAATSISLVIAALSSALMPSFAGALGNNAHELLLSRYENGNRVMLFLTGFVLFPLLFFGEPLLSLWVNPQAAADAWVSLSLLSVGFWLGAVVSNSYSLAVASRKTTMLIKVSGLSALFFAPVLYWMLVNWGIEGAAVAWLLLNAGYVLVLVPMVHRHILNAPVMPWCIGTLLPFVSIGVSTFGFLRLLGSLYSVDQGYELLLLVLAVIIYGVIGYLYLGERIRTDIVNMLRRLLGVKK